MSNHCHNFNPAGHLRCHWCLGRSSRSASRPGHTNTTHHRLFASEEYALVSGAVTSIPLCALLCGLIDAPQVNYFNVHHGGLGSDLEHQCVLMAACHFADFLMHRAAVSWRRSRRTSSGPWLMFMGCCTVRSCRCACLARTKPCSSAMPIR